MSGEAVVGIADLGRTWVYEIAFRPVCDHDVPLNWLLWWPSGHRLQNRPKVEDLDDIYLKDGSHLTGKVVSMENEKLKVETDYTDGDVVIEWDDVEMIILHAPLSGGGYREEKRPGEHEFAKIQSKKHESSQG